MEAAKSKDKIWVDSPGDFTKVEHTSQKHVLHPKLAQLINESDCGRLLDYGCGDGRMLKLLRKDIPVDVFDISPGMLERVQQNVGNRLSNVFTSADQIPADAYDIAVLSMVMVCIGNEPEYLRVLRNTKEAIKAGGKVLVAVTHPCFRRSTFSNFRTSYGDKQPFDYLATGEPFVVYIEDKGAASVEFEDFHWPLSFTFNKITQAGLYVERVIETTDDLEHPDHNPHVSPYLILVCKSHES